MMKKNTVSALMTAAILSITSLNAFATTIDDYKCTNGTYVRGPMELKSVGLGVNDGSAGGDSIVFCSTNDNQGCYSSQNYLNSDKGKADYAALLTAQATGLKVTFYCENGGYAYNIHIVR